MHLPSIIPGVKRNRARTPADREAAAKRAALDPTAEPFVPRVSSAQQNDDAKVEISLCLTEAKNSTISESSYYVTPSLAAAEYSSQLVTSFGEEDSRASVTFTQDEVTYQRASSNASNDVNTAAASNYDYPSTPPPTPSLNSTPHFSSMVRLGCFQSVERGSSSSRPPIPTVSELRIGASHKEEQDYYNRRRHLSSRAKARKKKLMRNPHLKAEFNSGYHPGTWAGGQIYQRVQHRMVDRAKQRGEVYEPIGKCRKAAVWEFTRLTFQRETCRPGKKRDYQRFDHYAAGFFPKLPPTKLRHFETMNYGEDKEMTDGEAIVDTDPEATDE